MAENHPMLASNRLCVVCHRAVESGQSHYYNFTTGEYQHRSCGLDQEGPREAGREQLITPAPRPDGIKEEP